MTDHAVRPDREAQQAGDLVEAFAGRIIRSLVPTTSIWRATSSNMQRDVCPPGDQGRSVFGERTELRLRDRDMPVTWLMP